MQTMPFFGHHQQTLHQYSFGDLRTYTFEQRYRPFMFDYVRHYFNKALEWFAVPTGWGA